MAATAMIGPKFYAWDDNGVPLAFGKLYTYQARTNVPKASYTSEDKTVENTNPVILNGSGYADVYLDGSYKVVLKDENDVEVWTADPVSTGGASEWQNEMAADYVSPTSFKVAGNFTSIFDQYRRIRIDSNATEYTYGAVAESSYAEGYTTVVIDTSSVPTGIISVATSIIGANSTPSSTVIDAPYQYAVSQLANGDDTKVAFVFEGQTIDDFEFLVYAEDGRIYAVGDATGTTTSEFDPVTGNASGISGGPLRQINKDINGTLKKSDKLKVMFETSGSDLTISQDVMVNIGGKTVFIKEGIEASVPTLFSATDYKIFIVDDGSIVSQNWDSTDPDNSVWVGGFHVSHTTATIFEKSLWDLGWLPSSKSPRAMCLGNEDTLWGDIYLMDEDYPLYGYSRGNQNIADGNNPPLIPTFYGGDGTTRYTELTWFNAFDVVLSAGKRIPSWGEFTGLAYGVVEAQAVGTDPVTTKYQAGHRSAIGLDQITGVLWQWSADTQGSGSTESAITGGRGSVYASEVRAALLGGDWTVGSGAGSRAANWSTSPSSSGSNIGFRAVCDHLIL